MSNYTVLTNYASKDALISGNPLKLVKGADLTGDFNAIAAAIATKIDGAVVFGPDGTASQPSYGFTNNAGVGMYNAAGVLGLSTGAASRLTISATGVVSIAGPTSGAQTLSLGTTASGALVLNANPSNSGYSTFSGVLALGTSGGDYPFVGYNVAATSTVGVYNYIASDFASRIKFLSGGLQLQAAASGVSTNPITFITGLTMGVDGGLTAGAPTGGDQGLGTLNATGLYINGGQLFFGAPSSGSSTAAVTDVGKVINAAGNIAINNAVFAQGNALSIYNNTAGNITINGTITTMRLAGSATTGNRTLAQRGMATLWFNSSSEVVVGGAGVT